MSIAAARVRSRAGQLVAIAVTAAALAGVGVGMAGTLESGLDAAVRGAAVEPEARMTVGSASADEVAAVAAEAFGAAPVVVADVDGGAVLTPDPARVGSGDLPALRDGAADLPGVLAEAGVASTTAVAGDLAGWAQRLSDLGWRARLLALVPFLVVSVGGLVAAREVVRVLALSRTAELAVIRSRGASRRRLVLGELREVAAVGAVGALVGGVVAGLVAGAPLLLAVALVAVVPLALAAVTVPAARAAIPRDRADEAAVSSGRGRAAGVVGLLLLFAAAGLSVWRLVSTGAADPAGVAAPAVGLLAGGVLVLAAVGGAARIVDAASGRWRGLGPALAVRRIARRLPMLATVVLLVAIAAASTVFAAAFGATGERIARDVRELRVGGDLLVTGWPAAADADALPAASVSASLRTPGEFGGDAPLIVLASADRLSATLRPLPGIVDPDALAADIAGDGARLVLPLGTERLEVATTTAVDGVTLRLWVLEPTGRVRAVPLDGTPIDGPLAAILALDADVSRAVGDISARVTAFTATVDGSPVDIPVPVDWQPQFTAFPDFAPSDDDFFPSPRFAVASDGLGFDLGRNSRDQVAVRLMPPGDAEARIPVVVTRALAERSGLEPGADIDVRFAGAGRYVYGTVADVVAALPTAGDSDAVLGDLAAFAEQQLRAVPTVPDAPDLVVRADDPAAVRADLPGGATAIGLEPGTSDRMLGISRSLLWFAAVGAVVVAIVGVAGVSASLVAERRRETRILGVLGELPARQARGQRIELALTIALAAAGGVAVGAILAVVLVPSFARAAAPGAGVLPAVPVALDLAGAGAVLVVFALALAAVIVVHGVRVVRAARPGGATT